MEVVRVEFIRDPAQAAAHLARFPPPPPEPPILSPPPEPEPGDLEAARILVVAALPARGRLPDALQLTRDLRATHPEVPTIAVWAAVCEAWDARRVSRAPTRR